MTSTDPAPAAFAPEHRRLLLAVARAAIRAHLDPDAPEPRVPGADAPELLAPGAVFVTLRRRDDDALRGCRGEVRAVRPLVDSVARQAVAAAVDDPRFEPVTAAELPGLVLHLSALGPLEPIHPDAIRLGRHGLMIVHRGRSGLLLPQVPALYDIQSVPEFLHALCRKAGLAPQAWLHPEARLYGFESRNWGEDDAPH